MKEFDLISQPHNLTRAQIPSRGDKCAPEASLDGTEDSRKSNSRAVSCAAQVLQWTQDWGRAQALAWRLALLYAEEFQQLSEPCPSVKTWLEALQKANVPCALVSHMPSAQLKVRV